MNNITLEDIHTSQQVHACVVQTVPEVNDIIIVDTRIYKVIARQYNINHHTWKLKVVHS